MLVQQRKEKTVEINTQKQQEQQNLNKQVNAAPEMQENVQKKAELENEFIMEHDELEEVVKSGDFLDESLEEAEDAVNIEKENILANPEMERLSIKSNEALKDKEVLKENIHVVAEVVQQEKQAEAEKEERKARKLLVPDLKVFEDCLAALQREKNRSDSFNSVRDSLAEFIALAKTETKNGRAVSDALLKVRKAGVAYYNSHRGHRSWLFGGHRRKAAVERVIGACEDYIMSDGIELSMRRHILRDIKNDPDETGEKDVKKKKFFNRSIKKLAPYSKEKFDDISFGLYIDVQEQTGMSDNNKVAKAKTIGQGKGVVTGFNEFDRMGILMKDYISVNGEPATEEDQKIADENTALLNKFYSNSIEDRKDIVNVVLERILEFEFKPEMLTLEYLREHYHDIYKIGSLIGSYENIVQNDPLNHAVFLSLPESVREETIKKADMFSFLSFLATDVVQMHNMSAKEDEIFRPEVFCHPATKVKTPKWYTKMLANFKEELANCEFGDSISPEELGLEDDYDFGDGKEFYKVEETEEGKKSITVVEVQYYEELSRNLQRIQEFLGDYDRLSKKTALVNWQDKSAVTEESIQERITALSDEDAAFMQKSKQTFDSFIKDDIDDLKERSKDLKVKPQTDVIISEMEKVYSKFKDVAGLNSIEESPELTAEAERLNRQYVALYKIAASIVKNNGYSRADYNKDKNMDVKAPIDLMFPGEQKIRKEAAEIGKDELKEFDRRTEIFRVHSHDVLKEYRKDNPKISFRDARSAYLMKTSYENGTNLFTNDIIEKMDKKYKSFHIGGNQNRVFEDRFKTFYLNEKGEPLSEVDALHLQYNKSLIQAYLDEDVDTQNEYFDDIIEFFTSDELPFIKLFNEEYLLNHMGDEWYQRLSKYTLAVDQCNLFEHNKGFFKMENLIKRYGKEKAEKYDSRIKALIEATGLVTTIIQMTHGIEANGKVNKMSENTPPVDGFRAGVEGYRASYVIMEASR